jgi:hypothetical protein
VTTASRGGSRVRRGSETLREQLYHGHLYLIDDRPPNATGDCSLFVRRLRLVRTPKGNLHVKIAADVWTFPDEDSMLAAIERYDLHELPEKADGDPLFVPGDFAIPGAKVEREYGTRIVAPEEAVA